MKLRILFLIILLNTLNINLLFGQIQLNPSDIYNKGKYKINSAIGIINPGLGGENQVWDFSTLMSKQLNTVEINDYEDKGMGIDANFVEIINGDTTELIKKTTEALYTVTGNREGGFQNIKFMDLPCHYGQKIKDSTINISYYKSDGKDSIDSIRVTTRIFIQSEADAWGMLKIPNGNFNTIRLKMQINYSVFQEGKKGLKPYFEIPKSKMADTFINYQWYGQNKGYCLLYYHDKRFVRYMNFEPINSTFNEVFPYEIVVSNPIINKLTINNIGTNFYKVFLVDMNGKPLYDYHLTANNLNSFDVCDLPSGIYFLHLVDKNNGKSFYKKIIKSN